MAQRLLMAYISDLITVLKSLFDVVTPSLSDGTMWLELNRVFQGYERLDPREQIHRRICANFQHDRQIGDPGSFRHELRELLMEREVHLSGPERNDTGGRNAHTGAPPASPPSTGKPPPSPAGPATPRRGPVTSPAGPAISRGGPATSPRGPATSPRGPATSPRGPATSPRGPATSPRGPATSRRRNEVSQSHTRRPVWRRLFPCLAPPPQRP